MKRELLSLTAAVAMMGAMASGAYAQSTPDTGTPSSTSPSTTPNDSTAVPPNTPVPPGHVPPAGATNPAHRDPASLSTHGSTSTAPGHQGAPGSATGMPTTQDQVPNRNEPGTTDPKMPNTGGK